MLKRFLNGQKMVFDIIISIFLFIVYTVLLFLKYIFHDSRIDMSTILEGYFIVNIFWGIIFVPVRIFHNELKNRTYFLNIGKLSKIFRLIFLLASIVFVFFMNRLQLPLDVMGSSLIWLFLFFCFVIK